MCYAIFPILQQSQYQVDLSTKGLTLSPPTHTIPYSQQGKYLLNERLTQSEQCDISSPFLISPELLGYYFPFCVFLLKHLGIRNFSVRHFKQRLREQA